MGYLKKIDDLNEKKIGLTCLHCGFMSLSPADMILHLAKNQVYKEENCINKCVKMRKR